MGYYHFKWICPYYKSDGKKVIRCEGGRLIFPSARMMKLYARDYCASYGYGQCSLAARLEEEEKRRESKSRQEEGRAETEAQGEADIR